MKPHQQTKANARARIERTADEDWAADVAKTILASCHQSQRDFAADPHRRVSALVGRGGGKTTGLKARNLLKLTSIPRAKLVYIALTRPTAEELLWEPLKHTCDELNWVIGKDVLFYEQKLKMVILRNGSELKLYGADKQDEIEKLRGKPFHEVEVDEAASHDNRRLEHLLQRIVGPRLGDYKGSFVMVGTPGHVLSGMFYDATRPGGDLHRPYADRDDPRYAGWVGWSSHAWNLTDPEVQKIPQIHSVWEEALVTKVENKWSDDHPVWRREYLGQWAADDTTTIFKYRVIVDDKLWNQWDPPRGYGGMAQMAQLPFDATDWLFAYGFDMGHSDPFCLQAFAFSPSDPERRIFHMFEFEQTAMYARTIAQLLLGADPDSPSGCKPHEAPGGVMGATGWPAGMVADLTHLGGAVLDELANVYGIRVAPAEQKAGQRFATVELFNGDLVDGRLKILKGSKLESQLLSLQWVTDEWGQLKWPKGHPDHAVDGAIYARRLIARMFESGEVANDNKPRNADHDWQRAAVADTESSGTGEFDGLMNEDWGNE